ncbi:MAG: radical SAM protein, partial [Phycisphaerae bacterium]|nr:radical SAM protein [Phycisphaerae bacterium]
ARFERAGRQIVLTFRCPTCPPQRQLHHDALWTDLASDFPGSASQTLSGQRIQPVLRRLPRTVESLCPECGSTVLGRYFVQDGAVFLEKSCPAHGYVRDCINSDVVLYSKAAWWTFQEHGGLEFPHRRARGHCPGDCGLCGQHLSCACLAQIDLTNRCNMRCPICFANAGVTGVVCEPPYEQVVSQLQALRDLEPTPCTAIQFTGGEPTLHRDFLRIVSTARDMGFSHIQTATNGILLADRRFAQQCAAAGLHTLYLQFDGVGEEPHRRTRNYPGLWQAKLATLDNCRATGMKVCLVPTILKGVNDDQVGEIFRFAAKNIDIISAISYQPVSFSGRAAPQQRRATRYTLGDLAHDIAEASGSSALRDMYPLSVVVPLSQILEALTGQPKVRPSCHPDCAFGTYFLVSPEGTAYPFPQVINIEGMFSEMNRIAADIRRRGRATWLDRWRTIRMFRRHFNAATAPPGLTVDKFIHSLQGLVDKHVGRGQGEKDTYKTLLCAGMHFQDRYNYDVQRARRCVILYSTPAGIFPFCTYNCGPAYRGVVESCYAAAGQPLRAEPSRGVPRPSPTEEGARHHGLDA